MSAIFPHLEVYGWKEAEEDLPVGARAPTCASPPGRLTSASRSAEGKDRVRFGASAIVLGADWEERLDEVRHGGCETVELWAAFGPSAAEGATFNYMDPLAVERAARAVERAGLRVHSMHGPIVLGPPGERSPFGAAGLAGLLEAERAAIDAVMAMGGRFVVTQDAGGGVSEDMPGLASRDALLELAEYARGHGCVFCIENESEDAAGFEGIVRLVRELRHPGLGICLDVGHAQVWAHRDVPRAIRECGPALRACHVHDNLGSSDVHLPVGDGIVPWRAVLKAFAEVGYRGPLVVESWAGGGRGPVRDCLARARALLEALAGECPEPVKRMGGFEIFAATAADRARASLVMGPEEVAAEGTDPAVIAVDRFGGPAGWAEAAPGGDGKRLETHVRADAGPDLGRAMAAALEEAGQAGATEGGER